MEGRHIDFPYNATSGDIVDNTIEQLDLTNMGIAVGTLFQRRVELEICLGVNFYPRCTKSVVKKSRTYKS